MLSADNIKMNLEAIVYDIAYRTYLEKGGGDESLKTDFIH